jgi:hypothetical protein
MGYTVTYIDYEDQEQVQVVAEATTEEEARRAILPGCKEITSVVED